MRLQARPVLGPHGHLITCVHFDDAAADNSQTWEASPPIEAVEAERILKAPPTEDECQYPLYESARTIRFYDYYPRYEISFYLPCRGRCPNNSTLEGHVTRPSGVPAALISPPQI